MWASNSCVVFVLLVWFVSWRGSFLDSGLDHCHKAIHASWPDTDASKSCMLAAINPTRSVYKTHTHTHRLLCYRTHTATIGRHRHRHTKTMDGRPVAEARRQHSEYCMHAFCSVCGKFPSNQCLGQQAKVKYGALSSVHKCVLQQLQYKQLHT